MTQELKRRSDWQDQLFALIEINLDKPFRWGSHDCAMFAADAIEAMTGHDPARGVRGRYKSEIGAAKAMRALGCDSIDEVVTARLGGAIAPNRARRGDVVLYRSDAGDALAVVTGTTAVAPGPDGLAHIPRDRWIYAWRIG